MKPYTLTTWADGFGVWYCRAEFEFPGLGNTGEAEAIKYAALRACKRAIRREITTREAPRQVRRLAYEIAANKLDSLNRLHNFTVREKGTP